MGPNEPRARGQQVQLLLWAVGEARRRRSTTSPHRRLPDLEAEIGPAVLIPGATVPADLIGGGMALPANGFVTDWQVTDDQSCSTEMP